MQTLSAKEKYCLKELRRQGGEAISPCDTYTLESLLVGGLVERIKLSALPLESFTYKYRLTDAGRRICQELDRENV